jgi:acetyl-CoA acetyltransferase
MQNLSLPPVLAKLLEKESSDTFTFGDGEPPYMIDMSQQLDEFAQLMGCSRQQLDEFLAAPTANQRRAPDVQAVEATSSIKQEDLPPSERGLANGPRWEGPTW